MANFDRVNGPIDMRVWKRRRFENILQRKEILMAGNIKEIHLKDSNQKLRNHICISVCHL